jgi:hypothetical protein
MRNLFTIIVFVSLMSCSIKSNYESNDETPSIPVVSNSLDSICTPISTIESAFTNQQSEISVTVKGTITRLLSDDTVGDRHQRFIIQLSNNQTILITHNVDIAPRVSGISVGDTVYVHGDYVWNSQGGLIHWTHHDPSGIHENGWIVFDDKAFQ